MSDNYGDLMDEARKLRDRAVELELEHQANRNRESDDPYTLTTDESRRSYYDYIDEHRGDVEAQMSDIPDLFEPLSQMPDPASFTTLASTLKSALPLLAGPSGHADFTDGTSYGPHEAYDKLGISGDLIDAWDGDAARAFRLTFVPAIERVVWNEFNCAAALHGTLLAMEQNWTEARKDASNLIDFANAALDVFEDSKDSASVSMALGILGTIVGVVAVPFTGGSSAAVAWSCASAALSVSGTLAGAPDKVEPGRFSADSPGGVIDNLREGIADFKLQLFNNESFVREKLTLIDNQVSGIVYTGTVTDPEDLPAYSGDRPNPSFRYSADAAADYTLPRPSLADLDRGNVNDRSGFGEPTN